MIALFAAALSLQTFSPTPQAQALKIVSLEQKKPAHVVRVNLAGRYAMVLTEGGKMEGTPITAPLLLEQFPFGWQALSVVTDRCDLDVPQLSSQMRAQLVAKMPIPKNMHPCQAFPSDAGPETDVDAVRKQIRGPLIPYVLVSRSWALGMWYGAGGGEALYHKTDGTWKRVGGGGGAMDYDTVLGLGVPPDDACTFHLPNAPLPCR